MYPHLTHGFLSNVSPNSMSIDLAIFAKRTVVSLVYQVIQSLNFKIKYNILGFIQCDIDRHI